MLDGFLASLAPGDVAYAEATLDLPFDQIVDLSHALLGGRRPALLRSLRSLFRYAR